MTTTVNRSMIRLEWGLLLTLSLLWGGSFFFVGVAVKELPPLTIVAMRIGLAALALHAIMRVARVRLPRTTGVWTDFLAIPVSAILPGILVLGERVQARHILGMAHIGTGLAAVDGRLWAVLAEKIQRRGRTRKSCD
jgi:drug/metabolite transporter (DMT)-like permease